jgi:hypothetical protein
VPRPVVAERPERVGAADRHHREALDERGR